MANTPNTKAGSVTVPDGVRVAPWELATAERLRALGYHVRFNRINFSHGVKNPDVTINGETWEFKSPQGSGPSTISNQFSRGRKQAKNLVIDLRRCGINDEVALRHIRRRFFGQVRITNVIVIDHTGHVTYFYFDGNL